MIERVCILLWLISVFSVFASIMFANYLDIMSPSAQVIESITNRMKINPEGNASMIFGDFIYALRLLGNIISGSDLAYLLSYQFFRNESENFLITLFINFVYYTSLFFLIIKFISNRVI